MKVKGELMRIGALARRSGVSTRLLRYYEEQGLLKPERQPNGYRHYAPEDVGRVRHIRALLAAGLPTVVIARLLDCVRDEDDQVVPTACPGMVETLHTERRRLTDTITSLEETRQALDAFLGALRPAD